MSGRVREDVQESMSDAGKNVMAGSFVRGTSLAGDRSEESSVRHGVMRTEQRPTVKLQEDRTNNQHDNNGNKNNNNQQQSTTTKQRNVGLCLTTSCRRKNLSLSCFQYAFCTLVFQTAS